MKILIVLMLVILTKANSADHEKGHTHERGHTHVKTQISKEKAAKIGSFHIEKLIRLGKLDASWKKSLFDSSRKKKFQGNEEWVVIFRHGKSDMKKKLYIFLKISGEFIAANFTGK